MKARAPGPTSRAPEVSGKLKAPRADRERRTALRATVGDSRGTVGERELQAMCLPLLLPLVLELPTDSVEVPTCYRHRRLARRARAEAD